MPLEAQQTTNLLVENKIVRNGALMKSDEIFSGHSDTPLAQVLQALQAAAAQPFEEAYPIPAAVNHSREFFNHERQAVFMAEWICVGRADEIASPGDYLTHDIAGVPVLVVRQESGTVQAFVNACAHRFACLMPDQKGTAKRFTCRYHAWTYDLGGQLVRAPYMEMKEDFDVKQHRLRPLHCEIWEGFVYVTLKEKPAKSVASALEPLRDKVVGRYDMAHYQTVLRETMEWAANWKNLVENFTESYHVPIAHKKTAATVKKCVSTIQALIILYTSEGIKRRFRRAPLPSESHGLGRIDQGGRSAR